MNATPKTAEEARAAGYVWLGEWGYPYAGGPAGDVFAHPDHEAEVRKAWDDLDDGADYGDGEPLSRVFAAGGIFIAEAR